MESRRSFLASALAWLASAVALLWPRRALSSPRRARTRGPFTRPSRPAEPSPVEWREETRVYRDGTRMFDEMFDHLCRTGHSVVSADVPELLRVGFVTYDATPGADEKRVHWTMGMPASKVLHEDPPRCFSEMAARDPETVAGQDLQEVVRRYLTDRALLAQALERAGRIRFERGLGPLSR